MVKLTGGTSLFKGSKMKKRGKELGKIMVQSSLISLKH